jgi:simple sugar transport system permease protein
VLFSHSPLVYVSWIVVPLTGLFLYRTRVGIHIRAVGENSEAARTAGISLRRMQYLALILGGVLCGLAGAHLSLGDLALFRENMTSGRGFIALAAVYFAAGRPGLSAVACLLFGLFEALQFRLQTTSSTPPQFFQMLPYLMVVLMLTLISARKEWRKGW